jgi:hypothetical protein
MAYESDFRPQMQLLDAKAPLPCEESMWDETDFALNQGSIQKNGNYQPTQSATTFSSSSNCRTTLIMQRC